MSDEREALARFRTRMNDLNEIAVKAGVGRVAFVPKDTEGYEWFKKLPPPPAPPSQVQPEALLSDPNSVHINMLRGTIAKPTPEQIIHIYGAEALSAALSARQGEGDR